MNHKLLRRSEMNLMLKQVGLYAVALTIRGSLNEVRFSGGCKYTMQAELAYTWYIFHPHAGSFSLLRPRLGEGTVQSGATSTPRSTLTHTRGTHARTHVHACTHAHACTQHVRHGKNGSTAPLSGQ